MAEYKIELVAEVVREYESKFGPMKSYKLKLPGEIDPVELSQKATTPAPKVGDVLNGHLEDTEYGKKFKKDFQQGGGFKSGASKLPLDNFTMYLSYAKDLAIACIAEGSFDLKLYAQVLEAVEAGGAQLYASRQDTPKVEATEAKVEGEQVTLADDPFAGMDLGEPSA